MSKNDSSDHLIVTWDCNVDLFARSPESDTLMEYFRIESSSKFCLEFLLTIYLSWIVSSLKMSFVHV